MSERHGQLPLSDANAQWAPDRDNCLVRLALRPDRKPVECHQGLQARLHIPEVDLALEKRDFIIQLAFVEVDVPGPRSAVASVAPTIATPLKRVLEVKRRLFRPYPHRLLASPLEQDGKRRRAGRRQFERENLEQGVAIVDRPMSLVEEAGTV